MWYGLACSSAFRMRLLSIVPKVIELELLQGGDDEFAVVALVKDAKGEHEHGIVFVDAGEAMVAALVDVHDVPGEL